VALIETKDLTKIFRRGDETIYALNRVSLTIKEGELLSIVGASGSGKSTLMYILGLIDTASSGSYILNDKSVAELSDDQRAQIRNQQIGFVFQSFHLLPRATALRNVIMPLIYSSSYQAAFSEQQLNERAEYALKRVGLADRMQHLPNQLSGGQRQRVAIARALVNQPKIIFADEPTGNLDSRSGNEILTLFEELHHSGVTVAIVTHDASLSARTHRTVTLRDGCLIEDRYAA
jgi:putative ABC transport system ATP-binding protein